jgi:DNA-binding GntR family transcriptional regulator
MVTDRLRELIIQGSIGPGTQLNEVELAASFGISRGPIREGLRQLIHDGLLRSEPHRGAFVPLLGEADIVDIFQAQEAIELAAVQTIFRSPQHGSIALSLGKATRGIVRTATVSESSRLADLDMRFHIELVRSSGSARLTRMHGSLIDEARICLRLITPDFDGAEIDKELGELVGALEADDREGSLYALGQHFRGSFHALSSVRLADTTSLSA